MSNEAIACIDVGYYEQTARAACVTFDDWLATEATCEYVLDIDQINEYVPGEFFRRELPCAVAVLEELPTAPQVVVIDGYVWLNEQGRKGLGAYLYEALGKTIPIVGVAKSRFAPATNATEVYRGTSNRPLLVTSVGIDQNEAADCIKRMHGSNRIPTLLKRVDQLSRTAPAAS